jgi:hypothetical protein
MMVRDVVKNWGHGYHYSCSRGVGVGDLMGRQRKEWFPSAEIRTSIPPAFTMACLMTALDARFPKVMQAFSRKAALLGCVFMTASMAYQGNR